MRDRLHGVGPQRHEAGAAGVTNRRIDDAVVPVRPRGIRQRVPLRVADGRIGVQARRRRFDIAQIDELAREARVQFRVIDGRPEVADALQLAGHVEGDFGDAGLRGESGVPGAPAGTVEAVQLPRPPIGKGGIDEVGVRQGDDELAGADGVAAVALRQQATARRSLDLGQVVQQLGVDQAQEHRITQARRRHQPHGALQSETRDRIGRLGRRAAGHRYRPPRRAST